VVVGLAESSDLPPERLAEPIEALEAGTPAELVRLGLWVAREYCSTPARGLELVLPPGVGRSGGGPGAKLQLAAKITAAGRAALQGEGRLGPRQRAALEALAGDDGAAGTELAASELGEAGADRQTLNRLEARRLVSLRATESPRRPAMTRVGAPTGRPRLSSAQNEALAAVVRAMDAAGERELLLHGVTGSG